MCLLSEDDDPAEWVAPPHRVLQALLGELTGELPARFSHQRLVALPPGDARRTPFHVLKIGTVCFSDDIENSARLMRRIITAGEPLGKRSDRLAHGSHPAICLPRLTPTLQLGNPELKGLPHRRGRCKPSG